MLNSRGLPLQNDSDAAIVARVLAGETAAYTALVTRYKAQYARFAARMLGNREDAEEALQDSFVRAYRSLAQSAATRRTPSDRGREHVGRHPWPRPSLHRKQTHHRLSSWSTFGTTCQRAG